MTNILIGICCLVIIILIRVICRHFYPRGDNRGSFNIGVNQTINQDFTDKWCDCEEATEVGGGKCLSCGKKSE